MALKSGRVGIHPSQVDPITGMLLSGPSGSTNYNDLSNKPQINGVTLSGNKTTSDLHIEAGASDLSDLDDVSISNPEAGQTLQYNGTGWENVFASISPVTPATLASLQDVMLSDLQDGDFISYDATEEKWVNVGEAPAPTYTDLTATIYGAVEDTISFTDAAGILHSEVFASGQSSKSVTFKINPTGSTSITFTSAVAKDPDNLSNDYAKTVAITSATTEVWLMPEVTKTLYWYGYRNDNFEECSTANGWSVTWQGGGITAPDTTPTNYIGLSSPIDTYTICGVGSKSTIASASKICAIGKGISTASTSYGAVCGVSGKAYNAGNTEKVTDTAPIMSTSLESVETNASTASNFYARFSVYQATAYLYALWYE